MLNLKDEIYDKYACKQINITIRWFYRVSLSKNKKEKTISNILNYYDRRNFPYLLS